MPLYNFSDLNILAAVRMLCGRLILKAESQQVDRILDAFSSRWCESNPNHGFKIKDVVHTICYSILLLNTDLHMADIDSKMTRSQFVKNTMPTILRVISDEAPEAFDERSSVLPSRSHTLEGDLAQIHKENLTAGVVRASTDYERSTGGWRGSMKPLKRSDHADSQKLSALNYNTPTDDCGPLVKAHFYGSLRTWEVQVEIVLKDFYNSIRDERLPLFGGNVDKPVQTLQPQTSLSVFTNGVLRRTPSVISKAPSEALSYRGRPGDSMRLGTSKWSRKNQSRPRIYNSSTMASSRTSVDDQSSMWSPSMSSNSFASPWSQGDYQQSIGFANAISQAIIREEVGSAGSMFSGQSDEGSRAMPLLEDESLGLHGAPWAKEGMVKYKHHLEATDKKAKDRNWSEVFVVVEKGYLTLFSFSSKSMRNKSKTTTGPVVVGGGNWQDNAENLGNFLLRQTIASILPSPGYSKARPHVWALSLPSGAVHLFQVGTPEVIKEFVSTANYWSARLSNPPLIGGISNIEYGWSEDVVNNSLVAAINEREGGGGATGNRPGTAQSAKPSLSVSLRGSIDQGSMGAFRAKLPGDKLMISEWSPPSQSLRSSNLLELDQLNTLTDYVQSIEDELHKHNTLRGAMLVAYTPRSSNYNKAMANWERKSSHLLREIVKYRTYIDTLQIAGARKEEIYEEREERKARMERDEMEADEESDYDLDVGDI